MRLFIASPVTVDNYTAIQNDFENIIEGKWVKEENLHLTWVFLGDKADEKSIIEKMQDITALEHEAEIAGLGYFGRPPRVFFAKAADKILYDKAREFKEAGFDLYRFKPHITLCRIKRINDYRIYKELMREYREHLLGRVEREIVLYESRLQREGPEYSVRFQR
jgi:2'-5' RNA ligase